MDNISNEVMDSLVNTICDKVLSLIRKELNQTNMEFARSGVVVEATTADDGTRTCKVDLGFGETETIPNLSGQDLTTGQKVKVYSDKQDLVGAYVGTAFDKEGS